MHPVIRSSRQISNNNAVILQIGCSEQGRRIAGIDCLVDNDWFEKILHHKSTNPEIIKLLIRKKSEIKDFVEKTYKKYEDGIKILSKYL